MAALDLFNRTPRHIQAIAFNGLVFVVYQGGMSCYDPVFNEWKKKACLSLLCSKFDLFIDEGKLRAIYYDQRLTKYQLHEYDASSNQWAVKVVRTIY